MFNPKFLSGTVVQKADIINDNFRAIRQDLIALTGKAISIEDSISVYNSVVGLLVGDLYMFGDTLQKYKQIMDSMTYTSSYSIITGYDHDKYIISELDSSGKCKLNYRFNSLEFPYQSLTSLFLIPIKVGNDVKYTPVNNITSNIEIIVENEGAFNYTHNSVETLFDSSELFVINLTTTDPAINTASVTLRLYVTDSNPTYNKVDILTYPQVDMSITDNGSNIIPIENGTNIISLSPSYSIDLKLTSNSYNINSSGAKEFIISIPYLTISNVVQSNVGYFGLEIPKPKQVHTITSIDIDSNIPFDYSFKLYESKSDMLQDINIIGTSELFPIEMLSTSQSILKVDKLYALFTITKKSLTDIVYINSFVFKFE